MLYNSHYVNYLKFYVAIPSKYVKNSNITVFYFYKLHSLIPSCLRVVVGRKYKSVYCVVIYLSNLRKYSTLVYLHVIKVKI